MIFRGRFWSISGQLPGMMPGTWGRRTGPAEAAFFPEVDLGLELVLAFPCGGPPSRARRGAGRGRGAGGEVPRPVAAGGAGLPLHLAGGFPPFQINHYLKIGLLSAYNSDVLMFDENTATQFDAPTHSVAPPDSGKPNAGKFGTVSGDKVPAWQLVGEACVIDCRQLLGTTPKGRSDLVTKEHVMA